MAYISKEKVAEIRSELKREFPQIKFSVVREHHSELSVAIMQAPVRFTERDYQQLNHFYLNEYANSDILLKIKEICNRENYDHSDVQSDYFEVGYYFSLSIGKWDKPFVLAEAKAKPAKKEAVKKVQPAKANLVQRFLQAVRAF